MHGQPGVAEPAPGGAAAAPAQPGAGRIATLDSLRGAVALVVVIHHVWTLFPAQVATYVHGPAYALWNVVQAQNHRAVMAFFVLSGFAIALATRGRAPVTAPALRDYLVRRVRRIVPLFYASLVWTAALGWVAADGGSQGAGGAATGASSADFGLATLVGNLVFLQTSVAERGNWFAPYGGNGPYWSLSYEMAYYLVLPGALGLVALGREGLRDGGDPDRAERLRLIMLGLAAMVSGLALGQFAPNPPAAFATLWIVWVAGFVAQGLATDPRSLPALLLPAAGSWGLAGLLALAGRQSATLAGALEGTALALVFGVLVTWRGWTRWPGVPALDKAFNAGFARIGRGSYALYLLHYPLLQALHRVLTQGQPGPGGWLAGGAVLVAFVVVFCPWVERVSVNLFRPRAIAAKGSA